MNFQNSDFVIEPEELVRKLESGLDSFEKTNPAAASREWTLGVKNSLEGIAKEISSSLRCIWTVRDKEDPENNKSEFLLDFVWWQELEKGQHERMALAVECEWAMWSHSFEEIAARVEEDFDKLTVIKSPLKLMVFCTREMKGRAREHLQTEILRRLTRLLQQYDHHVEGECYILFDTAVRSERKAWVIRMATSGSQNVPISAVNLTASSASKVESEEEEDFQNKE